jgi:hypothetical protein
MKAMKKRSFIIIVLVVLILSYNSCTKKKVITGDNKTEIRQKKPNNGEVLIFPVPMDVEVKEGKFSFDKHTVILIPEKESESDGFLTGMIFNELVDKYEQPVGIVNGTSFSDSDKYILIGDIKNPLVKSYCKINGLSADLNTLGDEGYILSVTENNIVVAANTGKGALFGLETLRQVIRKNENELYISQIYVRDTPKYEFRGIKLYLPGRENIVFFKRFIKDFAALFKFNKIILELNANMRLERHPELNIGTIEFERHLNFSRLGRPPGKHQEYQNSSHQDNADGDILEKEEVADLVKYIRKFNIEVIPELPSLTHSYYLLFGHEDLAENLEQPYPDTYCPLKPEIYKIYFDVLDEYIDVIHPDIIHVGHDEWRMEKDLCEFCRGKDYGLLYADDLIKIHNYLAEKGIKTAIWGDHLLESVTQKDFRIWKSSSGYEYKIPGALKPDQVLKLIPKDILIFNWFWDDINNDIQVSDFGFQQVYGNLRPDIDKWGERNGLKGIMGGAPSSWAASTENNIGKDQLLDFLGCSNLLWSEHYLTKDTLPFITEPLINSIYTSLNGRCLPSDAGSKVTPLNISTVFNTSLSEGIDSIKHANLFSGILKVNNKIFDLNTSLNKKGISVSTLKDISNHSSFRGININSDPNSIIFLHACAREGNNKKAYDEIYNFDETSELLGWYEIVYMDGFIETIPIRYGMNILDINWRRRVKNIEPPRTKYSQNLYAYQASAIECSVEISEPVTFFAFEWENSRFGKKIKEINLKAVNYNGDNENAIILLAVSITENKKTENVAGTERQ